ncbi:myb-binding protein 1A-like protein [Physella acuta]|uniref:myb-binding protein 1A-like protein n=1 Tax=Physella acuta TaxID=109671 RepID=UPI0027DEA555|nr:myb-binding protein 1A-like protein [Physella acuta]
MKMPAEVNKDNKLAGFRPSQEILDVFWTLSDGTDEQRNAAALKLANLIEKSEVSDIKANTLTYCRDRLVRGLSSGRKFARVGFSVALTQLLRQYAEIDTTDVLSAIKEKLKVSHYDKSKTDVGGIYLGQAFAFSTIIQSGRITQLSGAALSTVVEELLSLAEKKSYLKPVCSRIVEDLITKISDTDFEEHVWPKVKTTLKAGWESCTLDRVSLLLVCRNRFPKITKKKFLKKYWGFPLFSEENDDKLMHSILATAQKTEILLEKILPKMVDDDRDVISIWKGIGEKLMEQLPEKKADAMVHRQCIGLKIASKLLSTVTDPEQTLDFILSPSLVKFVFHSITKKNDPLVTATDHLFNQWCTMLKTSGANIFEVVERIWKLEATLSADSRSGKVDLVNSQNCASLIDLMSVVDAETYVSVLIKLVLGKDKWRVLSNHPSKRQKQQEWCLRQLQHITCSQRHTTPNIQQTVLALFLRLAFFHVQEKDKSVQHCERCQNFEENSPNRKLCETLFYKSLDILSTLTTGQQSKHDQFSHYLDLMFYQTQYIQTLYVSDKVKPIKEWSVEMKKEWEQLCTHILKVQEKMKKEKETSFASAFLILFSYLAFHLLTDFKTASELLQDIYVCYDKAAKGKKKKDTANTDEPHWVEVVTEVLLHLMSLPSHLTRVITAMVFKSLSNQLTPAAISLITEVLTPKKTSEDDAGGILVNAEDDEEIEEDSDDEDIADEESDDDDDEESEDKSEDDSADDQEEEKVDDKFRQSVKQALGEAALDDDEEEEDLPDLSDSEMFKLDDMLAEVFRQRKKGGGKKAREEKKKELVNLRVRVLDLVEVLIKGERAGDFLLDLLKPLILLMLKTNPSDSGVLCDKAKTLFLLYKGKVKALKDSVHSVEEQKSMFQELLELAQKVNDTADLNTVAMAAYMVMNLNYSQNNQENSAVSGCVQLVKDLLQNIILRKQTKPHVLFFTSLIELDPLRFQVLSDMLVGCLKDETTKTHCRLVCCTLLASLARKTDGMQQEARDHMSRWMTETADCLSQLINSTDKDNLKVMLMKEMLGLVVALQARGDIVSQPLFDASVQQHLTVLKPRVNTDLRRLSNRVIASIEKSLSSKKKQKKQKRKLNDSQDDTSPASLPATPPATSPAKKKRKM